MATDPELHITVVALTSGRGLEMTDEVALCKAALLYADRVTLASPRAILFAAIAGYLVASPAQRKDTLIEIAARHPDGTGLSEYWNYLRTKKQRTKDEIINARQLERKLEEVGRDWAKQTEEMLEEAKASELGRAMQAGVLDLDTLGADRLDEPYSTEAITRELGALIETVLTPESSTYQMFSELTGRHARALVSEGKIAGAELAPATQAGVAGRFISAMDAFPDAPMDVVLDARGKLQGPLRRFRGGVTRLSRELSAGGIDALDPRFQRASADLYREYVAPAMQEIEELSREIGLRNALLRSSPKAARDVALATMALVATTGGGVGELATLAAGGAADLVGRTATRQRELREKRDKNEFVFLYEADKRLGS